MKGRTETLSDERLENDFAEKARDEFERQQEEIALRNERLRARSRAIERARNQVVTVALLGETRLYRSE